MMVILTFLLDLFEILTHFGVLLCVIWLEAQLCGSITCLYYDCIKKGKRKLIISEHFESAASPPTL